MPFSVSNQGANAASIKTSKTTCTVSVGTLTSPKHVCLQSQHRSCYFDSHKKACFHVHENDSEF